MRVGRAHAAVNKRPSLWCSVLTKFGKFMVSVLGTGEGHFSLFFSSFSLLMLLLFRHTTSKHG